MTKLTLESFDPDFVANVERLAEVMGVSAAVYIENTMIRDFARMRAEMDVYGTSSRIPIEFAEHGEAGVLRGQALFEVMYKTELDDIENDHCNQLVAVQRKALTEQDIEILKRRRPEWLKD